MLKMLINTKIKIDPTFYFFENKKLTTLKISSKRMHHMQLGDK